MGFNSGFKGLTDYCTVLLLRIWGDGGGGGLVPCSKLLTGLSPFQKGGEKVF